MKLIVRGLFLIAGLSLVAACTPDITANTYSSDAAQSSVAQNAKECKVVEARPVKVTASGNDQTGMLIGGAAGAIAGSALGGGWRMNTLGALGGATVGGIAGKAIGERVGSQTGYQYVTKCKDGSMLSVIQGGDPYQVGQKVMVLTGGGAPARIISR